MRQEGVDHPAQALLRRAGRPVLADGSGMIREDCGKLGQDCPGPKSLHHQPWWSRGTQVNHGGRRQERQERPVATAVDISYSQRQQ